LQLLLVRHGVTAYNLTGRYTGQADVPLTELGQRQAVAVGKYLADEQLDVIISSDLQRARDTALAIAQYHKLPVLEDPELREISMGEWEGYTPEEIQARNIAEWTNVRSKPITIAPPGGESWEKLYERAGRALRAYQEVYAEQTVLWTTHGALIEAALCHALKLDLSYRHCFRQENTSISELTFDGALPTIVRLNDTAHLRSLNGFRLLSTS
jgi:broad specificity phosphatase PhoE